MSVASQIDTSFDLRTDSGRTREGTSRDPDRFSPTLRRYHRMLWSKALPDGRMFDLSDAIPGAYLHHRSELGEFWLASDSIIHTLNTFSGMKDVLAALPPHDLEEFDRLGYTIGGMILFPAERIDGKPTINGARGMHPGIRDRFDLTLECIRRFYSGSSPNPLEGVLGRYAPFFHLFGDFPRYVDFFLLQDLVSVDYSRVKFFTPFEDFPTAPLPPNVAQYQTYMQNSIDFVAARNARIERWLA